MQRVLGILFGFSVIYLIDLLMHYCPRLEVHNLYGFLSGNGTPSFMIVHLKSFCSV